MIPINTSFPATAHWKRCVPRDFPASWRKNLCGPTYLIRTFRGIILHSAGPGTGRTQGRP